MLNVSVVMRQHKYGVCTCALFGEVCILLQIEHKYTHPMLCSCFTTPTFYIFNKF